MNETTRKQEEKPWFLFCISLFFFLIFFHLDLYYQKDMWITKDGLL